MSPARTRRRWSSCCQSLMASARPSCMTSQRQRSPAPTSCRPTFEPPSHRCSNAHRNASPSFGYSSRLRVRRSPSSGRSSVSSPPGPAAAARSHSQRYRQCCRQARASRSLGIYPASSGALSSPTSSVAPETPTIHENFFEFVERDDWDAGLTAFRTIEQIEQGKEYYIISTTGTGLYRYFMNDIVRVAGSFRATPTIEFVQKGKRRHKHYR